MAANRAHSGLARAAWLLGPALLALVTWLGRVAGANATTVGFLYLLAVLAAATWAGWSAGALASLLAALCLNYFFVPPVGTFTVEDPANWAALLAFLGASTLVSRLVARSRREAAAAEERRREVQALYELSFGLFAALPRPGATAEATTLTLQALGARSGALVLGDGPEAEPLAVGEDPPPLDPALLRRAREERRPVAGDRDTRYLPLEVGGQVRGVLACRGAVAGPNVVASASRLLALAVERERLLAESAHLEAVRASGALLASLLRAVSHDLRTPLTAMGLDIESLSARLAGDAAARESLRSLAAEQERLARRIDNLLSSARLEAGLARPHPEPVEPADLFRATRESLAHVLAGRELRVQVEPECPAVWLDPSLGLEMLVNLLENAARAAPRDTSLELTAAAAPGGRVLLEVADRGPGLPPAVQHLLQAHADLRPPAGGSGDSAGGGLGLLIARGFAEAQGGTLTLMARQGGGAVARLDLPAAPAPPAGEGGT